MRKLIVLSIILGIALQTTAFAIQEPTSTSTKKIRISRNKKDQIREYTLPAYWSSYNDEYLNKYIDEALENNFDLKIAKSRIKQSDNIMLKYDAIISEVIASFAIFKFSSEILT